MIKRMAPAVAIALILVGGSASEAPAANHARPATTTKFSNDRLLAALLTGDEVKAASGSQAELAAPQDYCYTNGCERGWFDAEGQLQFVAQIRQLRTAKLAREYFAQVTARPNGYGRPTYQSRSPDRAVFTTASSQLAEGVAVQRRGKLVLQTSCDTTADRVAEAAQCASRLLSEQGAKARRALGS